MAAISAMAVSSPMHHTLESARSVSRPEHLRWRLGCDTDTFISVSAGSSPRLRCRQPRCSIRCVAAATGSDVPTVADTKTAFLKAYRKPIPSIYNNVLQELIVQQHLMRYNATYQYDAVFALGFVTVYDQLMDGYPSAEESEKIFVAYIKALGEEPDRYREDAKSLEEWAASQTASSIASFSERDGEVESILKDIAARAEGKVRFHYSRFFAIGLFRLVERANASDPAVLEQLCKALNVSKLSVDRDLDVYRNLLTKLSQAKELLKEYIEREKRKSAEREATKASEPVA